MEEEKKMSTLDVRDMALKWSTKGEVYKGIDDYRYHVSSTSRASQFKFYQRFASRR